MKDIIINILNKYSENTSLSEGHYAYMIEADEQTLKEIAGEIEKEIKDVLN